MVNIIDKIRDVMLGGDPDDNDDRDYDEYDDRDYDEYDSGGYEDGNAVRKEKPKVRDRDREISSLSSRQYSKRNTSKIVNIHTDVQMEVIVTTPESLEEAGEVCDDLKYKKTIVVNLEKVEHETAQRISDFLCGACYALDGSVQLISDEIFIIGPVNVDITGRFKEELKANGIKLPYTAMWK